MLAEGLNTTIPKSVTGIQRSFKNLDSRFHGNDGVELDPRDGLGMTIF